MGHLYIACRDADLEFMQHVIGTNKDDGYDVDWSLLINTAYVSSQLDTSRYNPDYIAIVRLIQASGRLPLGVLLHAACKRGDLVFVEKHISAEGGKDGVDWKELNDAAKEEPHQGILHTIKVSGKLD